MRLRGKLNELNRRSSQHLLASIFQQWKGHQTDFEVAQHAQYAASLICYRIKFFAAHRACALELRRTLRAAKLKTDHLQARLQKLDSATPASTILRNLKDFVGPTNLKNLKKKTVPMIKKATGAKCRLSADALNAWIDFFRTTRMPWSELRARWLANLGNEAMVDFNVPLEDLPTLTDLELALRRTACGKARGADAIPGELLHHCPAEVARLLYPSLWKLLLHGQEDVSCKGGVLVQAYKGRGPIDVCASFRSLLISSQAGKAIHRTIRTRQADIFEKYLQFQQSGGRRKLPVLYGLHLVRAHLRQARLRRRPASVIFIDLTEPFYRIFLIPAKSNLCHSQEHALLDATAR